MAGVEVLFLSRQDIDALELSLQDVLDAVEVGLEAHGNKKVIMPSKDHLVLDFPEKLFNILKGYVEPVSSAGVKVIGDFEKNYEHDMPSEFATVILFRPETGAPYAILNGTSTTWMRTGAVTAIGAKYLACDNPKVLGHIGARGTAWYNVAMLDLLFDFEEIRVTSKRPASRERFAAEMSERLGKKVHVVETSEQTVRDADIIIDASRLLEHEVLVDKAWVKPGALVQPYGAVLSTSPDLPMVADKFIVDDWNQCKQSQYGQFAGLIQEGALGDRHCYGEIGEVVAGLKLGRESQEERIVFWHKGFAVSDIVIGHLAYEKAREKGIGTLLSYDSAPRDM